MRDKGKFMHLCPSDPLSALFYCRDGGQCHHPVLPLEWAVGAEPDKILRLVKDQAQA